MYGINYLIVCMDVNIMFKNIIDRYIVKACYT